MSLKALKAIAKQLDESVHQTLLTTLKRPLRLN